LRFFPASKSVVTGNPVRETLLQRISKNDACKTLGIDSNKFILMVMGGSLGARKINQLIKNHLHDIQQLDVQLIWQCGNLYAAEYQPLANENTHVVPFIDNMPAAYAAADLVVSRAGALAISELCLMGKPTLFIPSPNVAENHQEKNAQSLVDNKAAKMVVEHKADNDFWPALKGLIEDEELRELIGKNMTSFAHPNAAKDIVEKLTQLISHE
jgi:UDP-N-acetylglucosamine--N-acetylmuramyl-(pentapeptide) pyrophosphoryl-undecaprenol N-acetylglucosamine transferase